ncbi:MAG: hypothetical protein WDZ76_04400 [Pseudohongiellaceae bacterium]
MNLIRLNTLMRIETQITLSLFRYWAFLAFAFVMSIGMYVSFLVLHAAWSASSPTLAIPSSRHVISYIGFFYLVSYITGIVFLAFEIRGRDSRARMLDILDSRPYTNGELVLGRFLGVVLCSWVPVVILLGVMLLVSWALPWFGFTIGGPLEPLSLVGLALFMALPAMAFCCALVMLVSLLVRNRVVALIISLLVIFVTYVVLGTQGFSVALSFDLVGAMQLNQPSEWVPSIADQPWWVQRAGLLFMSAGLLALALAIHPRLDGTRRVTPMAAGVAFTVCGLALGAVAYQMQERRFDQLDHWRAVHETRQDDAVPDVQNIRATVSIDPGRQLRVELELRFTAASETLTHALFTLNPGFTVTKVVDGVDRALQFEHADGLLEITLQDALNASESATVKLNYAGLPNTHFGYLDSALDLREDNVSIDSRRYYGLDKGVFEASYVALTPGIRWLPAAGVDVGRGDPRQRAVDFFTVDMEVSLPSDWTAAGPGRRQQLSSGEGDRQTVQFSPASPIPEVALMAARFAAFSTELEGIHFEVLLHPKHTGLIDHFAFAREEIERWVNSRLRLVAGSGLRYPFDAFTLVEVPNILRGHQGGWRMDTALAPPGMLLIKEQGLPTARFDIPMDGFVYRMVNSVDENTPEVDPAIVERDRLINYFINDLSGGNVFSAFARNYFLYRTAAVGREAIPLNYMLEDLASLLVSGERSYFSAIKVTRTEDLVMNSLEQQSLLSLSPSQRVLASLGGNHALWESAADTPLAQFDPWRDPTLAVDELALRSGTLAQAIYDTLGAEGAAQLLGQLLTRYGGSEFTFGDLLHSEAIQSAQLDPVLSAWFHSSLAGFRTDDADMVQLADSESGDTRYQLRFTLRNTEAAPGLVRVFWSMEALNLSTVDNAAFGSIPLSARLERSYSEPLLIAGNSAVEFGAVFNQPPATVYVEPYMSLNRTAFLVRNFDRDNIPRRNSIAVEGVRKIDPSGESSAAMAAALPERIVIDDLDPGFSVNETVAMRDTGLIGQLFDVTIDTPMDQGLPVMTYGYPIRWSRRASESAWGEYRRTVAYIAAGEGDSAALFETSLPRPARWRLDLHMPAQLLTIVVQNPYGNWQLAVVSDNGRELVDFHADSTGPGWNQIGLFDLPAGPVVVELSNYSDGLTVVADAVSWTEVK